MNHLKDYILLLDNWIPKYILDKTLEELPKNKFWKQHKYTDTKTLKTEQHNGDKELDICYGENLTYIQKLHDLTWKALEKYIIVDKIGGNNLTGWSGFSQIRFNRYDKDQIMSQHIDHIVSLFPGNPKGIPILSIVSLLNDNYQGGEFIMFDDYEIKFKAGDLLIFPSVFLYPHLVKPVTKGIRYAFVSWCY